MNKEIWFKKDLPSLMKNAPTDTNSIEDLLDKHCYPIKLPDDNRSKLTQAIQTLIDKAEIKGIMYCYLMGGVTPEQQEYMDNRLAELKKKGK